MQETSTLSRGRSTLSLGLESDPSTQMDSPGSVLESEHVTAQGVLKVVIQDAIGKLPSWAKERLRCFGAEVATKHLSVGTLCSGTDGAIDTLKDSEIGTGLKAEKVILVLLRVVVININQYIKS